MRVLLHSNIPIYIYIYIYIYIEREREMGVRERGDKRWRGGGEGTGYSGQGALAFLTKRGGLRRERGAGVGVVANSN